MTKKQMAAHIFALLFLLLKAQTAALRCIPPPDSPCRKMVDIHPPFRLKSDRRRCGKKEFTLSCENDVPILYLFDGRYVVESISYGNKTIKLTDPDVRSQNCSSRPRHSLAYYNFRFGDPFQPKLENQTTKETISCLTKSVIFMSCQGPVDSPFFVDAKSCADTNYTYVLVNGSLPLADLPDSCRIDLMALVSREANFSGRSVSFSDVHRALAAGIELAWDDSVEPKHRTTVFDDVCIFLWNPYTIVFVVVLLAATLAGRCILCSPFVAAFLIRQWRRRHLSMDDRIEEFLQSNNIVPIRYSYSDIKKMTKGFICKLGKGGYGTVYKGELRSGRSAAIKMLSSSQAENGEDFMNEVSTLGRIHHVNIVRLIGYCVEGSKRGLVYDFMPKGSLDRYIFSDEGVDSRILSTEKIFEIALGVARGIEYLHLGCAMRILHFDIKPHNILLDENFCPKVSDFGLARLCPLDENTFSLSERKGTLGYVAPEVAYQNIGRVSHKADVYSFGKLLMNMASRGKNVKSVMENSSEVNMDTWLLNQFREGKEVDFGVVTEEEKKMVKKMMVVALWCLPLKPSDRLSMSEVVVMLEQRTEDLQLPPTRSYSLVKRLWDVVGEESSTPSSSYITASTSVTDLRYQRQTAANTATTSG